MKKYTSLILLLFLSASTSQASAGTKCFDLLGSVSALWKTNKTHPAMTQKLEERIKPGTFFITAEEARTLQSELKLSEQQLLVELIPLAKKLSRSPISKYQVGAVGLSDSGNILLGTNIEFSGHFLNQTIHGEQFVFALAKLLDERSIKTIAIGAAPCGHCRQFMNEAGNSAEIKVSVLGEKKTSLKKLLPQSFGPKDLDSHEGLLTSNPLNLFIKDNHPLGFLEQLALKSATKAYSPYGKNAAGIALDLKDGSFAWGSSLEVAAHNPSLTALHVALVDMVRKGLSFDQIQRAVLVEEEGYPAGASQEKITEALLNTLSSRARLTTLKAHRFNK